MTFSQSNHIRQITAHIFVTIHIDVESGLRVDAEVQGGISGDVLIEVARGTVVTSDGREDWEFASRADLPGGTVEVGGGPVLAILVAVGIPPLSRVDNRNMS